MKARSLQRMNRIKKPGDSRKTRSSVLGPRRAPILGLSLYIQEASQWYAEKPEQRAFLGSGGIANFKLLIV